MASSISGIELQPTYNRVGWNGFIGICLRVQVENQWVAVGYLAYPDRNAL